MAWAHFFQVASDHGALTIHRGLTLTRAVGYTSEYGYPEDSNAVGLGPAIMLRWTQKVSGKLSAAWDASGSLMFYNRAHPAHGRAYGFLWRTGPRLIWDYDGKKSMSLPFYFMGWVVCVADTAYQWLFTTTLNNAHVEPDGDFSEAEQITHTGALVIGTYDNFTCGDPARFLKNLNDHMPTARENELIFIPRTGHTYQQKEQELADHLLRLVGNWRQSNREKSMTPR